MELNQFLSSVWKNIDRIRFYFNLGYIIFSLINVYFPNGAFDTVSFIFGHFSDI